MMETKKEVEVQLLIQRHMEKELILQEQMFQILIQGKGQLVVKLHIAEMVKQK